MCRTALGRTLDPPADSPRDPAHDDPGRSPPVRRSCAPPRHTPIMRQAGTSPLRCHFLQVLVGNWPIVRCRKYVSAGRLGRGSACGDGSLRRLLLMFGLLVASVGGVVGSAEADAHAAGPGILVSPDLPEPAASQFVAGASNVVSVRGTAANDIRSAAGTSAATAGTYTCPGFSTVDDQTPLESLYQDTYAWGGFAPYKVGDGSG